LLLRLEDLRVEAKLDGKGKPTAFLKANVDKFIDLRHGSEFAPKMEVITVPNPETKEAPKKDPQDDERPEIPWLRPK
jgi:hypothetical protein